MLPNMDYSLIHRTPDGTGKILVTTPGSPDKGSYVLESDMKIYTNQGMVAIADIVDDLVTADAAKPLSANQGVVLKQLIDAFSGGIVPKGDILSSNLPPADASNKGWQYYCTDINQWATSDGTQWIMTSNNVITQTPDATDTGHALSNAVVTQCCNEVRGKLNQHESRLENLEQKAGDYTTVQYRGTNAVPTGKAKNGLVEKIVGKSRAWNQLVQNGNFASGDGWVLESGVTASFSDNVATISSTTSSNGIRREIDFINGHKYLVSAEINTESALDVKFGSSSSGGAQVQITTSVFNQFVKYSEIKTASANTYQFYIFVSSTYSNLKVRNVTLYDLTLIFGSGNEPSTVADALAQLPALGEYNAYDAGSLVDTEVSGVKSVGVNIWDEEWEYGGINSSTGANSSSSVKGRSVDFIPIKPNTAYYILSAQRLYYRFYDREKNYLGDLDGNNNPSGYNTLMTTPSACFFFRFLCDTAIADNSIQICLNSYADKTTYHPYKTDTLSLSETVTLRSAGSVAEVLNVESGMVTHPIGSFDLGDYNWTSAGTDASGYYRWEISPSDITIINWRNAICGRFLIVQEHTAGVEEIVIHGNYKNVIYFTPTQYTSETLKTAMNGVSIICELATPSADTYVDPIIDNFIEVEGGGTINTIQEQSPVIDNCLDVGYLTV